MPIPLGNFFADARKTDADPSGYPRNWTKISAAFRKKKNYTCDECGANCSAHTRLAEVHHINGDKSDCRYENLRCLCIYHHWRQPMHGRYKPQESEMRILRRLWEEQNIPVRLRERYR